MAMTSAPPDAKFGEHRTDPGGQPMKHRALGTTTPSDDEAGHLRWRPDPAGGVTARSPIRTPMSGLAVPSGHHGPADAWFGMVLSGLGRPRPEAGIAGLSGPTCRL